MNSDKYSRETVVFLHAWTPTLVSLRITRPEGYRFTAGQFARLGLAKNDPQSPTGTGERMVWRAYSIASATDEDELEFCSVLLPEGEFTSELARLKVGDSVYVERNSYGFLTTAGFAPGKDLWMIATGTGLAPFISMLLEARNWNDYENLVVAHSVREAGELAYRGLLEELPERPCFGASKARLHYIPIVTRESVPGALGERLPRLLESGQLEAAAQLPLDLERSRILLCGNPAMVTEMRALLSPRGYATSRRLKPGTLAVENYW
ncbi:MAG: ferredoxin--NADP reductase [Burkholderiaceae bacterium]|jgi:ferredoxin--NADP+ reductase